LKFKQKLPINFILHALKNVHFQRKTTPSSEDNGKNEFYGFYLWPSKFKPLLN